MDTIKKSGTLDPRVASRYTVVLAAAKRARQLTEGAEPLTNGNADKPVSTAIKEMREGKLHVKVQDDLVGGTYERMMKDQHKYRVLSGLSKDDLREDLKDDYTTARTYKLEDDDGSVSDIYQEDSLEDSLAAPAEADELDEKENLELYEEIEDVELDESFDE